MSGLPEGFAVDISHWQPTFSIEQLRGWRAMGLERVIVKLGGANNGIYVASDHAAKTANARAAGMRVQHYWFNGRDASLEQQAQLIAAHVPPGERLWWDVEPEGSMPRWSPAEVVQAARALAAAGIPLGQQGIYLSESVTRAEDWAPVVALGLPLWVAAYRRNDGRLPETPPAVQHWPGHVLWQYTDAGQLPGFLGGLDLNTTRGGIPEGSSMTPEQYAYWADFWGSPDRRHNPYGAPGDKGMYEKGYHRGEDIANDGAIANVPALWGGTIVAAGRSRLIGYYVAIVYDLWPDVVFIHCHLFEPTARTIGRTAVGEVFARTADMDEKPGLISGPHLHLVASTHADGGHNTARPDFDPKPYIAEALASIAPPQTPTGDMDMRYFYAPGRGGFTDTLDNGPVYPATAEEAQAISKFYAGIDVTDREWDVLRQASLNRQAAAGKDDRDAITTAVNTAISKALAGGKVDVTFDTATLAAAVRAEFTKTPLR